MLEDAPLVTARRSVHESIRVAAPLPLDSERAWIEATVAEQISVERARRNRADAKTAIARAERGQEACLQDFDPDDPVDLALYERAQYYIREERQRVDRAAAAQLAIKLRDGRWPG